MEGRRSAVASPDLYGSQPGQITTDTNIVSDRGTLVLVAAVAMAGAARAGAEAGEHARLAGRTVIGRAAGEELTLARRRLVRQVQRLPIDFKAVVRGVLAGKGGASRQSNGS